MKTLEITTASGTYLVLDLPEDSVTCTIAIVGNIFIIDGLGVFFDLPDYNYKIAGYGKDHPELVEELGLLSENPYLKPLFTPLFVGHSTINDYSCRKRYDVWHEAEKRVFVNPIILKKDERKSI